MTLKQKSIAIIYSVLLVLILGLEFYNINFSLISWIRFLTMFSLSLVVVMSKKKDHLKGISIVFILIVAGDFFLVLSNAIQGLNQNIAFLGFIPFTGAYLVLGIIYLKLYKLSKKDAIVAIPFILLSLLVFKTLNPYVEGFFLKGVSFILLLALLAVSWSSVLFLFRDIFTKNRSIMIAISGILMLACDLGVGFDLFYPDFYQIRNMVPINLVWLFYIPGWVLLAIAAIED
ncbi:MAG: hypothetical protein RBQ97_12165 [Acholeplasma sp.]|nr:hypothetical protein [Acholeplasma sp.]